MMRQPLFVLLLLSRFHVGIAQDNEASQPVSTSTASQSVVQQKLSNLEQAVAELKTRLDQSNTNSFQFGKFIFSKTVKIQTPTAKVLEMLPSQLSGKDKERIVSSIQQGFKSLSFPFSDTATNSFVYTVDERGIFGVRRTLRLKITAPQDQRSLINYTQTIPKRDFTGGLKQQNAERSVTESNPVNHVLISIHSGMINQIEVDAGGHKFSNRQAPILLRKIQSSLSNRLFSEDGTQYITLGHAGGIIKEYHSYTSKPYLIDDQEYHFIPSSQDKEDTLMLNLKTDSDNYVKIRLFTDLLGLANQRNPLTQIEGTVRVVLNSIALFNSRKFMAQHIQLRISNARFDSKQDTLRLAGLDTARTELFRKANWYGNLKLAVLSHRGNVDADLLIGLEGRLVKHVYSDQLKDQTIFVGGPLVESAFRYTMGPNATLNLIAGTVFSKTNRKPEIPNNDKMQSIAYVSAEADYAPFNSPSSRIFFRLNHYWNWTVSEPTITQAQLGYSGTLSGILSPKSK